MSMTQIDQSPQVSDTQLVSRPSPSALGRCVSMPIFLVVEQNHVSIGKASASPIAVLEVHTLLLS